MLVIGAILTVFIAGLMVGRTPEYLGKKVEGYEIKMAMITFLVLGASILGFTALASVTPEGLAGPLNKGPHGFSEILYAYSSQTGNNGSAFAGLTGNTPFYNVTGGLAMIIGRYGMIVPILALAGSMAAKRRVAPSLGTFPTTGPLFTLLLIGVVVIVGALTFFPALSLGPIVEQLLQNAGKVLS
jgi:K+-transporting ATPase ATPase A chain